MKNYDLGLKFNENHQAFDGKKINTSKMFHKVFSDESIIKKDVLKNLSLIAEGGSDWKKQCFPPKTKLTAIICLKDLITHFLSIYVFCIITFLASY